MHTRNLRNRFFGFSSIILMIAVTFFFTQQMNLPTLACGLILGGVTFGVLIVFHFLLKRLEMRAITLISGFALGCLLTILSTSIYNFLLDLEILLLKEKWEAYIKLFTAIVCFYLGIEAALLLEKNARDVTLRLTHSKIKDLVLDFSALLDSRLVELAATGLFDCRLVLPRFLLKEIYKYEDCEEESLKAKTRKALESLKKLEALPLLEIRYHEMDFPEMGNSSKKMILLASYLNADVLYSEKEPSFLNENVRAINLHHLSKILKPTMPRGESLKIKIQRTGKEEKQGIGYLEDGTMVVVNGGGHFIGETIKTRVLSVKQTASGRMLFCNVDDEEKIEEECFR